MGFLVRRSFAVVAWLWRYQSLWLLVLGYTLMSGIYVFRRYQVEYAYVYKAFYLSVCFLALWKLVKNYRGTSAWRNFLLSLFGLSLLGSVWNSQYPVRASSELDILLTSFAMSYLFWTNPIASWEQKLRLLGVFAFLFLHFSIGMCCACCYSDQWRSYPWETFFRDFCFSPSLVAKLVYVPAFLVITPLNYSNYQGYCSGLLVSFFIGLFCAEKKVLWKILWLLGCIYGITTIIATNSRMSFFGMIPILAIWSLVFVWFRYKKWMRIIVFVCLFAGILYGSYHVVLSTKRIKNMVKFFKNGKFSVSRFGLARTGWELMETKPILGHGMTTTPLYYLEGKPEKVYHFWQLHVPPIQWLIEFGWMGGLAYVGILATVFYGALRLLFSFTFSKQQKLLLFGVFASFLYYLNFLSEDTFESIAIAGWVGFLIGLIWFLSGTQTFSRKKKGCGLVKLLACVVFGMLVGGSFRELASRTFFECFVQKTNANDASAEQDLQRALRADSQQFYYLNQATYANIRKNFPRSKDKIKQALSYYEKSLLINPTQTDLLESCGALYATLGNIPQAVRSYLQAIQYLPYNCFAYANLLALLHVYGTPELFQEWIAFTTYAMPLVIFSQIEYLLELRNHPELQKQAIEFFARNEEKNPSVQQEFSWIIEKTVREKLFFDKPETWSGEARFYGRRLLFSWEEWFESAACGRYQYPFYRFELYTYSNDACRYHAEDALSFRVATFVPLCDSLQTQSQQNSLFVPKNYPHIDERFEFVDKYAREMGEPLFQKTLAAFDLL